DSMKGKTITLTSGVLTITNDVSISGDIDRTDENFAADITVSGGGDSGIFAVTGSSTEATFRSLTLTGGSAAQGGAINATGGAGSSVIVVNTTIAGNTASGAG